MLNLTLAGLGGLLVGASLAYNWFRIHATDDAATVARMAVELREAHDRHMEQQEVLWAILGASQRQMIAVDRWTDKN